MENNTVTVRCYLCLNPADWVGWDGDPSLAASKRIPVCGLHMTEGDSRIPVKATP